MGALRERMIEEMKLRNFSASTQKTYLYADATGEILWQSAGSTQ
jgi:hypothetical protein